MEKSNLKGLEGVFEGLDTSIYPDTMRKAALLLKEELILQARKSLSREVGLMGKQIGIDVSTTQTKSFLKTLDVKVKDNEFLIEWKEQEVVIQEEVSFDGKWLHPSHKKGSYLNIAVKNVTPSIISLVVSDIMERWRASL